MKSRSPKSVQFYLQPELHRALKMSAAQHDRSISDVVRELIADHCQRDETVSNRPRPQTQQDEAA